jgi:hypothetical protein
MSETTIVNKRGFDADDTERLSRRRSLREQAAQRDIELLPARLAEQDIEASRVRRDEAADQHSIATQPLQEELGRLEEAAISRIGRREPPDAEADARRAELTQLIAAATAELEAIIRREREIQSIARRKARKIREGRPPADVLLMKLAQGPLASPRLLAEQHVCRQRVQWLEARRKAAKKALEINQYNVAQLTAGRMFGDLAAATARVAAWEREVAAVAGEIAAALAEQERIHQALLDE